MCTRGKNSPVDEKRENYSNLERPLQKGIIQSNMFTDDVEDP